MRWAVVLIPLAFFGLSALFMALNPLTRHAHAAIVAELATRRDRPGGVP
jgi:Na+/melibiose symporter-like transporter